MTTGELISVIGIIVGIGLGLWGAGLSTYLAIREKQRDKRRVKVILEQVAFGQRLQLSIINGGFRPVTITSVSMGIGGEGIPGGGIDSSLLPKTLEDGDYLILPIDRNIIHDLHTLKKYDVNINVYDAEGNVYKPSHVRTLNLKWGGYSNE